MFLNYKFVAQLHIATVEVVSFCCFWGFISVLVFHFVFFGFTVCYG